MYKGSSGCPGFTEDALIFGMHNRSVTETQKIKGNKKLQKSRFSIFTLGGAIPSIIKFLDTVGAKYKSKKSVECILFT